MPTSKIIFAWKTVVIPALLPDVNDFEIPGTHKKEDAIVRWREAKAAELPEDCALQPYTSTFTEIRLLCTEDGKPLERKRFVDAAESGSAPSAVPVSLQFRNWLLRRFPTAWPNELHPDRTSPPAAVFIGFSPRRFLKILGIELSLPRLSPDPEHRNNLPLSAWVTNSDHRDLQEIVMPKEDCKSMTWKTVLKARGLEHEFPTWAGPGQDIKLDLDMALRLAVQVGVLLKDLPIPAAKPKVAAPEPAT